jgi:Ser/Thr protein kinase RdoA (MazF antagonist)
MPPDDLAAMLSDGFGIGSAAGIEPVARGAMGAVWRLTAEHASYAAKELFWFDPGEDAVAAEVAFVERCREAGVRSQRAVATPSGRYVLQCAGRWWRLYEWIDGTAPDRTAADTAVWLTAQMARIHAVGATSDRQVERWYLRVEEDWPGLAAKAARAGVAWAGALAESVPRLAELTGVVNGGPAGPAVHCHRDLNGDNVVIDPSGAHWLVDWDNCGPLQPWRELGGLLTEHVADPAMLCRLAEAYRDAGGTSRDAPADATFFATGLAIWLNFLGEQARSALDGTAGAEQQEWSAKRVAGLIGPFPSPAELDAAAGVVHGVLSGSRAAGPA